MERLLESNLFFQHGREIIYRGTATQLQAAAIIAIVGAGPLIKCKSWWASEKLQVTVGRYQLQFGADSAPDSLLLTTQCNMDSKELESPEQDSKRFITRKYSCLVGIVSVVLTGAAVAALMSSCQVYESYVWAETEQVYYNKSKCEKTAVDTSHDTTVTSLLKTNKVAPGQIRLYINPVRTHSGQNDVDRRAFPE